MPVTKVDFFRSFLSSVPAIGENAMQALSQFRSGFEVKVSEMNPQEANEFALQQMEQFTVNQELSSLYHDANAFMYSNFGDGASFAYDIPIVANVTEKVLKLSGKSTLSLSALPHLIELIEQSVTTQWKIDLLHDFVGRNAAALQEYRMQKLESATHQEDTAPANAALLSFTLHQQVLAVHYLLTEGMGINNIDNTKVIALTHLLAGKKIPLDQYGQENIGNSGIKSAYGKMWQKDSKRHLADVRFVLNFFKPFERSQSEPMKRIIDAIEKEIGKTQARLDRKI